MAHAAVLDAAAFGASARQTRRSHSLSHQRCRTRRLARAHFQGTHRAVQSPGADRVRGGARRRGRHQLGQHRRESARRHVVPAEPGLPVVLQAAGTDRQCRAAQERIGPPDAATLERGKKAYEEACAMCHGADRAGTPAAPSLLSVGGQIGGPQFRRIVVYGNGRMPPLPHVTEEQIGDILAVPRWRRAPALAGRPMRPPTNCRQVRWWPTAVRRARRFPPATTRRHRPQVTRKALVRRQCVTSRTTGWATPIYLGHRGRRSWPTTSIAASSSGASPWARISTLPRPAASTPACRAARSARA